MTLNSSSMIILELPFFHEDNLSSFEKILYHADSWIHSQPEGAAIWTRTTARERVERLKAATERASGGGRGPASPASMPTSSAFSSTSANGFGEGAG